MTQAEIEHYLFYAFVFDDDLDMMARALIQLGGVRLKPSRLKTLMLGYNVADYVGVMGEIVTMKPCDIHAWKCSYFAWLQAEEEKRAARAVAAMEKTPKRRKTAKKKNSKK
jgi:hypothetical protein